MGWKIVRDKQREYCLENNVSGQWRISPDPESALVKKLGEEYGEFAEHRDPAELFDMLDVIMELRMIMDPLRGARDAHSAKRERLGAFSDHLEWTPLPEGDGE